MGFQSVLGQPGFQEALSYFLLWGLNQIILDVLSSLTIGGFR